MDASHVDGADPTSDDLGPVLVDTPLRLRFTVGPYPSEFPLEAAPGFISSINDALARHADAQLDSLEISLVFRAPFELYLPTFREYATGHPHAALVDADHVRAWLRYGMARAAKSFVLEVPPRPAAPPESSMALELPASAAAATMTLTLGNATLTLPASSDASFRALTELLLSHARIDDGDRLGKVLSSASSPCLKRLRLEYLMGVDELDLCVDELEELTITSARDLVCLEVSAPCLRTLRVTDCSSLQCERAELSIYAPALEVLACSNMCMFQGLQIDAPSVRDIRNLPLSTHGYTGQVRRNEASIRILKHCTAAHRLNLHLHVPEYMREFVISSIKKYSGMVDYESILVKEIPVLPNITALTVTITTWKHSYAASLAWLIAQCVNLVELHIDVNRETTKPTCADQACVCHIDHGWENQKISLERLRDLDIAGVQGLDYEKRLAVMILAGAPAIERMKLPACLREGMDHGDVPS